MGRQSVAGRTSEDNLRNSATCVSPLHTAVKHLQLFTSSASLLSLMAWAVPISIILRVSDSWLFMCSTIAQHQHSLLHTHNGIDNSSRLWVLWNTDWKPPIRCNMRNRLLHTAHLGFYSGCSLKLNEDFLILYKVSAECYCNPITLTELCTINIIQMYIWRVSAIFVAISIECICVAPMYISADSFLRGYFDYNLQTLNLNRRVVPPPPPSPSMMGG